MSVEAVFMPEHQCLICTREIPDGTKFQICAYCYSKIVWLNGRTCAKCGDVLASETTMVCDKCKNFDYVFDHNTSCCYYGEESATLVKTLKYGGKKYYAKHIAEIMFNESQAFKNIDIITFVPISRKRRRARGFNQAEVIATELGKLTDLPVLDLLVKVSESKNQAKLGQKDRIKNLIGSFGVNELNKDKIKGKNILIIDDVFTTGTTLNETSKVIKAFKPKSVNTFTFAKTEFKSLNF